MSGMPFQRTGEREHPGAARILCSVGLSNAVVSISAAVFTLADWHNAARPYVVLVALLVGTGWAIVGWIDVACEFSYLASVTLATGLGVAILLSICLVVLRWWHPAVSVGALLCVSTASNVCLAGRSVRGSRGARYHR